jgi:hypothetical protein
MIALASDYLLFELPGGETVPFSATQLNIELSGPNATLFDAEFVRHAANAIFHFFKFELGRETVTIAEFASALEKVLGGFAVRSGGTNRGQTALKIFETDLRGLVEEVGHDAELFFFARLRQELRRQLSHTPRVVRFSGLRGCVKRLMRAQRWSPRCRKLKEEIIAYLRHCLSTETMETEFSLLIE